MRKTPTPSAWKGFLAGAVGGLVASYGMSQFHGLVQKPESPAQGEEDSTVKAASAISRGIFHHRLTAEEKTIAGPATHYGFGATVAALYGAAAESAPIVRTGWGLPFGAAVWLGAHVIVVPALGLSEPVTKSTSRKEGAELGSHFVYGLLVEGLRRFLRTRVLR